MGLRETLDQNRGLAVGLAIVVLLIAGGVLAFSMTGRDAEVLPAADAEFAAPDQVWFFDVGTGELFPGPGTEPGPIAAPSGTALGRGVPGGVRAHVFACGDCDDPADRFVAYVTLLPEEERIKPHHLRNEGRGQYAAVQEGQPATGLRWAPPQSPQALEIMAALRSRCPDGPPKTCLPPSPQ